MALNYNPARESEPESTTHYWGATLVVLLLLIGAGIYYVNRPAPPPAPKPRRLSPDGTFFVVSYISARIKSGVIGFEPGRQVHLTKVLQEKQRLMVSDGTYEVEATPDQLTNDLDIAELARLHDASSQGQLATRQNAERAWYEKSLQEQNEAHTKDVASFNQEIAKGSAIGTYQNPLNKGAERTNTVVNSTGSYYGSPYYGSPYSYFNTPYRYGY